MTMPQPPDTLPPNREPPPARVPLHERVEVATIDERQRAVRALLRYPLITAAGLHAAEFLLVRRHADWLRRWFARHPGWSLPFLISRILSNPR